MAKKLPVAIYYLNGKQVIRSKPAKFWQTSNTRKAGKTFGKTSSLTAAIVRAFEPVIPFKENREPYNTVFKALMNWMVAEKSNPQQPLKDALHFKGLRFVQDAGVDTRFKAVYSIDYTQNNQLAIHVPAFVTKAAISAPPGCKNVALLMMAVSCKPKTGEVLGQDVKTIAMVCSKNTQPAIEEELTLPMPVDSLTFVAFALKYDNITWNAATRKADRRWMPAGIVSCWWR